MSRATMVRRQGTRVTRYVGTSATAANGNVTQGPPWTVAASDVPVSIQEPTEERVQKTFGLELVVDAIGYADPDAFAEGDRLLVTAGPFLGDRHRVAKRIRHRNASVDDQDELALESTTETFP